MSSGEAAGAWKATSASVVVFYCTGVQTGRRVHKEMEQPKGWTVSVIKIFSSKFTLCVCSVDMMLGPLNIFLLPASSVKFCQQTALEGSAVGKGFFNFLHKLYSQQNLSCSCSVNTSSGGSCTEQWSAAAIGFLQHPLQLISEWRLSREISPNEQLSPTPQMGRIFSRIHWQVHRATL